MAEKFIGYAPIAGREVRIERLWNGVWALTGRDDWKPNTPLQGMLQAMADDGYDFVGKIDDENYGGYHTEDFLFIKAK